MKRKPDTTPTQPNTKRKISNTYEGENDLAQENDDDCVIILEETETRPIYPKYAAKKFAVVVPGTSKKIRISEIHSATQLANISNQYPNLFEFFHNATKSESGKEKNIRTQDFLNSAQSISIDIKTPSFIDKTLQKEILGSLYIDNDIPIYKNEIRPDLFGMFPHLQTDGLRKILEREKCCSSTTRVNIELLLGISGSGKTFKLFAKSIHQDFYLIFMICTPPTLFKSHGSGIDLSSCIDFTEVTDPSYQLLLKRLENYSNFVTRHVYVDNEVQLFLMSRLLYLSILIKRHDSFSPALFLQYQVNGYLSHIQEIYSQLIKLFEPADFSALYLKKINSFLLDEIHTRTGKKIGFALDEVNSTDQSVLKLNFLSKTSNKFSSFTNYFLANIISLGEINHKMCYLGISGTNFDMNSCERYLSGLYKEDGLNIYYGEVDSIKSKAEINSFFSKFLNVTDSDFCDVINDAHYIKLMTGRKRLLAKVILDIGSKGFKGAVKCVYIGLRNSLLDQMNVKQITIPTLFWLGICNLFHIFSLSRGLGYLQGSCVKPTLLQVVKNFDWIPTGLCNVEVVTPKDEEKEYKITISNEMFVVDALMQFIKENRDMFVQHFLKYISHTPEMFQPQPFEMIVMVNIISKQVFSIRDFISKGVHNLSDDNHLFATEDTLKISQFGYFTSFEFVSFATYLREGISLAKKIQEYPDQDHSELRKKICGKLVKPTDSSHQDFITFQYCKRLKRIFIVEFSLKCSDNEAVSGKDLLKSVFQLRTDMYFGTNYCEDNGYTPNPKYRDLLDELIKIPSLKIHIVFPECIGVESVIDHSSATNLKQEVMELVLNKTCCVDSGLLSQCSLDYINNRHQDTVNEVHNFKETKRPAVNVKKVHLQHVQRYSTNHFSPKSQKRINSNK